MKSISNYSCFFFLIGNLVTTHVEIVKMSMSTDLP